MPSNSTNEGSKCVMSLTWRPPTAWQKLHATSQDVVELKKGGFQVRLTTWWATSGRPCHLGGVADRLHAGGRGHGVAGRAAHCSPFIQLSHFTLALLSTSGVYRGLQLCTGAGDLSLVQGHVSTIMLLCFVPETTQVIPACYLPQRRSRHAYRDCSGRPWSLAWLYANPDPHFIGFVEMVTLVGRCRLTLSNPS